MKMRKRKRWCIVKMKRKAPKQGGATLADAEEKKRESDSKGKCKRERKGESTRGEYGSGHGRRGGCHYHIFGVPHHPCLRKGASSDGGTPGGPPSPPSLCTSCWYASTQSNSNFHRTDCLLILLDRRSNNFFVSVHLTRDIRGFCSLFR